LLWATAFLLSLTFRPLFPVDETRYVSVAWEMWARGDFLVPHLNGELYGHKPPLLFWLMQAGWWVFGVNEWWPRLVPALFALGNLALCTILARRLWPDHPIVGPLGALMLASSVLYFVFTGLVMFDLLVAFFALAGVIGVLMAAQEGGSRGWLLVGASIGLGILAKGPVILLHVLPVALLAPLWQQAKTMRGWGRWYAALLGALVLGSGIALAWALAAAHAGGEAYAHEIFWSQTADRVVDSFAHRRSWWWYLPVIPLTLLPWSLWPPMLRVMPKMRVAARDAGVRFVLAWVVPPLVIMSLISGKQPHYLLPIFAGVTLLGAYLLTINESIENSRDARMPGLILCVAGIALITAHYLVFADSNIHTLAGLPLWPGISLVAAGVIVLLLFQRRPRHGPRGVAAAMAAVFVVSYVGVLRHIALDYDMAPFARHLASLEKTGVPVAHVGKYYGEFQFLGRLKRPLPRIEPEEVETWFDRHPQGRVVALASMWEPQDGRQPEYRQPYRSNRISVWTRAGERSK
jgi:4-amino-4-deoxy-L-arabinose transferase-like glycosyltransferase